MSAELNGEVFYVLYGKISKILSKKFNEQKNMHYTPAFALKQKQGKRITMFIFVSKEIQEILEGCTQTRGGERRDGGKISPYGFLFPLKF